MATKSAILAVRIISDAREFSRGTSQASSDLESFGAKAQSIGKKALIPMLAIGAGALKVGSDYVKMASELEQNSGAVDAVFKGNSDRVNEFADNAAKKLGVSASNYKKYSSLVGSQLKNAGVPMDELTDKTDALINIGADFAAQYGGGVPKAIEAVSSALKGEFDPLEAYGISLNAAKIEAKAMEQGAKKVNGRLTDQAKAAAITALINEQGADAMGANGREADTAAGKHERLTAQYEDMGAKLGEILLPFLNDFMDLLTTLVTWISDNTEAIKIFGIAFGILAGILIALAFPFTLLAIAVTGLIAFIVYLATQTTFFGDVWAAICQFAIDAWGIFVTFITDVWNGFMGFLGDTFNNIRGAFDGVITWIRDAWSGLWSGAADLVNGAVGAITDYIDGITGSVRNAIDWVGRLFSGFSVPGWLRDVMSFMGIGGVGFEFAGSPSLAGLGADMGAVGPGSMAGLFGGGSGGSTTVNNYTINIDGALDTDGVARQIEQLLRRQSRNTGSLPAAGGF